MKGASRTLGLVRNTLKSVPGMRAVVRRARRVILTRDLRRLHDVLAATPLTGRYAVTGGMLLGWARDGRLLLDDLRDVDFVFEAPDAPAFASAVPMLVRAGFEPKMRFRNNDGEPVFYRFKRHGACFEFFVVWNVDGRTRYYMFDGEELVCERLHQPNTPFDFLGRSWLKPADHERALSDNYKDWRGPASGWSYAQARTVIARHPARFVPEAWDATEMLGTG